MTEAQNVAFNAFQLLGVMPRMTNGILNGDVTDTLVVSVTHNKRLDNFDIICFSKANHGLQRYGTYNISCREKTPEALLEAIRDISARMETLIAKKDEENKGKILIGEQVKLLPVNKKYKDRIGQHGDMYIVRANRNPSNDEYQLLIESTEDRYKRWVFPKEVEKVSD